MSAGFSTFFRTAKKGRKSQILSFFVALALSTISNADTLMILDRLWASPAQRMLIGTAAKNLAAKPHQSSSSVPNKPGPDMELLDKTTKDAALGLVGWQHAGAKDDPRRIPSNPPDWILKILGLGITAFAVSLGAPFWFDVLGKVMSIRAAGPSPDEKSPKDGKSAGERNRVHSSNV